tara:strand:+ start:293 stop:823 length:531 start_codon:yes stop_codon:yes gene_type:complete
MKNIKKSTGYLIVAAFWMVVLMLASTKTQAQVSWCDSVSYTIGSPNNIFNVTAQIDHIPVWDSANIMWSVCNSTTCYSANTPIASFPFIQLTDTLKVCYDLWLYTSVDTIYCQACDSIIYDGNSWVLFSMSNPVGIEELMKHKGANNKMHDMLGRELTEIPLGEMYIKNKRLHITK